MKPNNSQLLHFVRFFYFYLTYSLCGQNEPIESLKASLVSDYVALNPSYLFGIVQSFGLTHIHVFGVRADPEKLSQVLIRLLSESQNELYTTMVP